jgi:beta-galactosidase GanA
VKNRVLSLLFIGIFILPLFACFAKESQASKQKQHQLPHLQKAGETTQLVVSGSPFLICGGELGNSSFTSLEYMAPIWEKLKAMHVNTVLAPIYWELIELEEGRYDFALFDQLILKARKYNLKLVLLWFGSWKNSMSSHAPAWVKKDQERFPRVKDDAGKSHEILTPFSDHNLQADLTAFQALMEHIKESDRANNTVIMIQVENEIGMLPVARDYHPLATAKFQENVPAEFITYLQKNIQNLVPEFRQVWAQNGFKTSGTWEEVFGKGAGTDEIFMAWHYAKFVNAVINAGKLIYPLPMYVNAALNRAGAQPGKGYPSAGPLPHLMDVWKAGGPDIDFLSPDFYFPDFMHWCDLYTRQGNPLFVPEHRFDNTVAAKAAFAFGHYQAIGFSPFSIEAVESPENEPLGKMYALIDQLSPLISAHHGQHKIEGVLVDKENQQNVFQLGDYEFTVRHSYTLGYETDSKNDAWDAAGALIVQTADNEFFIAGSGVVATFKNISNSDLIVGILKVDEGRFDNSRWHVIRHLNGDQTHQGRHVRIFHDDFSILRFELYNYN